MAKSTIKLGTRSECRHCGDAIVFKAPPVAEDDAVFRPWRGPRWVTAAKVEVEPGRDFRGDFYMFCSTEDQWGQNHAPNDFCWIRTNGGIDNCQSKVTDEEDGLFSCGRHKKQARVAQQADERHRMSQEGDRHAKESIGEVRQALQRFGIYSAQPVNTWDGRERYVQVESEQVLAALLKLELQVLIAVGGDVCGSEVLDD